MGQGELEVRDGDGKVGRYFIQWNLWISLSEVGANLWESGFHAGGGEEMY